MTSKRNRTKPAARQRIEPIPASPADQLQPPAPTIEEIGRSMSLPAHLVDPANYQPAAPADELLEDELALELGPSPLEDLAPPRPAAVSSPPANRITAADPKPVVDGALTRCKKCGSTERTGYANRRELRHNGTAPDGLPYNLVVWRDTRCAVCLQLRCDRHYEQTEPVAAVPPLGQV